MQNPKLRVLRSLPPGFVPLAEPARLRSREQGEGGVSSLLPRRALGGHAGRFWGSCYLHINSNKELFDLRAWSSGYF